MVRNSSMRRWTAGVVIAGVMALVGVSAGPVSADTVEIPVGEAFIGGAEGDVIVIGGAELAADLVGRTCNIVAEVTNQGSVHPGNKLVVTSGESSVEIAGIEDVADAVTRQGGSLTLGPSVEVAVVLGPDAISSLGSSLTVTCEALPPAPPPPPVDGEPPYTG